MTSISYWKRLLHYCVMWKPAETLVKKLLSDLEVFNIHTLAFDECQSRCFHDNPWECKTLCFPAMAWRCFDWCPSNLTYCTTIFYDNQPVYKSDWEVGTLNFNLIFEPYSCHKSCLAYIRRNFAWCRKCMLWFVSVIHHPDTIGKRVVHVPSLEPDLKKLNRPDSQNL